MVPRPRARPGVPRSLLSAERAIQEAFRALRPKEAGRGQREITNMAESVQRILKRRTLDRPAPAEPEGDRYLVPADRTGLESAAHAIPLERQAPATAAKATRRWTRHRHAKAIKSRII